MDNMRAKFYVDDVEHVNEVQTDVTLMAVVSDDDLENQSFNKATPYGELKMMIDNPDAKDYFTKGDEYYLDFTKA